MSLVDALQQWADALEAQISMMRTEVIEVKSSNRDLNQQVGELTSENQRLKDEVKSLNEDVDIFKGNLSILTSNVRFLNESQALNFDGFGEILAQNSMNLAQNEQRFAQVIADQQALRSNVQLTLFNASMALFNDVEDLRSNNERYENDLNSLQSSIDYVTKQFHRLNNDTSLLKNQILTSLESMQTEMEVVKSEVKLNVTQHVGQMAMNVTKLKMEQDDLKNDVFDLNNMVVSTLTSSEVMQESLINLTENMEKIEGNLTVTSTGLMTSIAHLASISSYNSTLLQRGFFGLERHFIDMKRKMFEVSLQIVSINSTTQTLGELKKDLMSLEDRIENKTRLTSERFEDLTSSSLALQESLTMMWNVTNVLGSSLEELSRNQSFTTGRLNDLFNKTDLVSDLNKNRTNMILKEFENLMFVNEKFEHDIDGLQSSTDYLTQKFHGIDNSTNSLKNQFMTSFDLIQSELDVMKEFSNLLNSNLMGMNRNQSSLFEGHSDLKDVFDLYVNRSSYLEVGIGQMINHTLTLHSNLTQLVLRSNQYFDLTDLQVKNIAYLNGNLTSLSTMTSRNFTQWSIAANIFEAELGRMASGFNGLKKGLANYASTAGKTEVRVKTLASEAVYVKSELDSLRFDMASVKAEAMGVNVFVTSMQSHIADLTTNMTSVKQNMTSFDLKMDDLQMDFEESVNDIEVMKSNISEVMTSLDMQESMFEAVDVNMGTMKANVLGLGEYINSINSDLGSMLTSFDLYAKKMNSDMTFMKANMTEVNEVISEMEIKDQEMDKRYDSLDYSMNTVKSDLTDLTTKIYNLKTSGKTYENNSNGKFFTFFIISGFENSNDLTTTKSSIQGLQNNLDSMLNEVRKMQDKDNAQKVHLDILKTDLTTLKKSLTGLSAAILEIKGKLGSTYETDSKMAVLYTNITTIKTQLTTVKETLR